MIFLNHRSTHRTALSLSALFTFNLLRVTAILPLLSCNPAETYSELPVIEQLSIISDVEVIQVKDTVRLTAVGTTVSGTTVENPPVQWVSANSDIASVDADGLVHGRAVGSVEIIATLEDHTASYQVDVIRPQAVAVAIQPDSTSLVEGSSLQFRATAKDKWGDVVSPASFTWKSSAATVVKISSSGLATALRAGNATISASMDGILASARAVVTRAPVGSVALTPSSSTLAVAQTVSLTPTVEDTGGRPLSGRSITWSSSNPLIATVDQSGKVIAIAAGTAKITATCEGISGTAAINVVLVPVASVTISPTTASLEVGGAKTFSFVARDAAGNILTGRTATWSSSATSVATVSLAGVASAKGAGTAKIRATVEGKYATATLTVTDTASDTTGSDTTSSVLSSITVSPSTASLEVGQKTTLTATAKAADGTVLSVPITWTTSNSSVATVTSTGVVTGAAAGKATIRATSGGIYGSSSITVTAPDTTTDTSSVSVTLTASATTITAGGSTTLSWTSKNATECVATGGWSGAKALSGSASTGALTRTMDFAITCRGATGSAGASAVVVVNGTPAARYPLKVNGAGRYLLDADGKPYLIHADAAWSLIVQLTREQVDAYLEDRRSRGFNAVLVNLVEHYFAKAPPKNAYGDAPFTTAGDFTTPNEAYFAHADYVIKKAAEKGILVMLAPAYLGASGGEQGWYQEMLANGATKMRTYGEWVGKRYQPYNNIFWIQGGDYKPADMSVVRAVAEGIRSIDVKWPHTFHASRGTSALGFLGTGESWLTVNNAYTGAAVVARALLEYNRSTMPYFLIEAVYENVGGDESDVRRQAYQANLSGATGQIMGNRPIWPFEAGWEQELSAGGSVTLLYMKRLLEARKWWALVPDQAHVLLTAGIGDPPLEAVAAKTSDGMLGIVYVPSARSITLNLSRLAGPKVVARWYDPTSGKFTAVKGGFLSTSAPVVLTTPGKNARGFADWVLVLESAS